MSLTHRIEFEPEYLEEFKAYLWAKQTVSRALYALDLLNHGHKSEDVLTSAIRNLKMLEGELTNSPITGESTYITSVLLGTLQKDRANEIIKHVRTSIDILEKAEQPPPELYKPISKFFMILSKGLTKDSQQIEERVLGRFRAYSTYHTSTP